MKEPSVTLIKNLRYSKLDENNDYYYICTNNSFMNLTDDTNDLELIQTWSYPNEISENELKMYIDHNVGIIKEFSNDGSIYLISICREYQNKLTEIKEFITELIYYMKEL